MAIWSVPISKDPYFIFVQQFLVVLLSEGAALGPPDTTAEAVECQLLRKS
jgi:hypothetical protein